MTAGGLISVGLAALAAAAVSWWAYARLEEPVSGRTGSAVLRGFALFLLLAGWWLPPLWTGADSARPTTALLVDRSLSMSLPASVGGMSRADSAALVIGEIDPSITIWFGDSARSVPDDVSEGASERADDSGSSDAASRVLPGLEAARAEGADHVVLVTDGELDDREEARPVARRLGLTVREERVAERPARLAIRAVDAPAAVEAGDTIRLVVEVAAPGESIATDSASLSVTGPDGVRSIVRFEAPTLDRTRRVPVGVVAVDGGGDTWRAYDVRLEPDADPFAPGTHHRVWIEIVPTAAGAVIVAVDPDWEPHYLLPVLARSTAGGARAWLRVGPDRWIRSGTERVPTGDDDRVRNDASRAQLLVVQGTPGGGPAWLDRLAARHPRVLWFARGSGTVPGSGLRVGGAQPGEWYPGGTVPSSPIAGFLEGLDHPALPPVSRLFDVDGFDWAPLELRRNRAGAGEPPIAAARAGDRRRVVVAAEGTWRWASRAGAARQAYRSLFAGLAGWLLEAPEGRPVELVRARLVAGDTVRWRVASGVSDLRISIADSAGAVVWIDTIATPDSSIAGPPAPAGSQTFVAEGNVAGEAFRTGRPFEVEGAERELAARPVGPALEGAGVGGGVASVGGGRAMWPFVLAALMLCGEWYWRRRIGLR